MTPWATASWRKGSDVSSLSRLASASGRHRILRFLIAGGLNTLFGFGAYSAALLLGAPVWASLLIANLTGIAFNFFTIGGYVFRSMVAHRFPRFAGAYLVLYGINWVSLTWLAKHVSGEIVAQAILTLPLALLSYLVMARFVFNRPPLEASS
jgi:putative flippase GtrA